MTLLARSLPLSPIAPLPGGVPRGFLRGTRLLTVDGPMPVEEIEPGEAVLDPEGRPHFVLWQGGCDLHPQPGRRDDAHHPMRILANAFGAGVPRRDLLLAQQERVQVETGEGRWVAQAGSLGPQLARIERLEQPVAYHAVVTREPCLLMAENLPCESLQPGQRVLGEAPPMPPYGLADERRIALLP